MKTNKSFKSFALKNWKTILVCVIFALTLAGGGLLVVNLTQTQKNLEVVSPVDAPSTAAWSGNATAFTHGTGTESDPYLVESAENLAYLSANYSNFNNCYFKQTVNIDLNGSSHHWIPINHAEDLCSYFYDGNNKSIANLVINVDVGPYEQAGLFGCINNGYIKNLSIISGTITYTGTVYENQPDWIEIGAFIGFTRGIILIENCSSAVNISGYSSVGGIVGGYNEGTKSLTIKNCSNSGALTTITKACGGIVGRGVNSVTNVLIENCTNSGVINASTNYAGGIVGEFVGNQIILQNCSNNAAVSGHVNDTYVGGICGSFWGDCYCQILNCTNSGTLTATDICGGIVGHAEHGEIKNCSNQGQIVLCNDTDNFDIGGIVGQIVTTSSLIVESCQNNGNINSTSKPSCSVGGIIGVIYYNAKIINCENLKPVNGTSGVGGVVGYVYPNSVFKLFDSTNSGNITSSSHTGGIVGHADTSSMQSVISNCLNTGTVSSSRAGGIIGLCDTNIVIQNSKNAGSINGNGDTTGGIAGYIQNSVGAIRNCINDGNITGNDWTAGICGAIGGANAEFVIENCVNSSSISAPNNFVVGGILGGSNGEPTKQQKILNCQNLGTVNGDSRVGGIVGQFDGVDATSSIVFDGCVNHSAVNGRDIVGGLIGITFDPCTIQNSCNYGAVSSTATVGGLLGYAGGNAVLTIKNCFNKGSVNMPNTWGTICGGIVGCVASINCNISFCYNLGNVTASTTVFSVVGGIVGRFDKSSANVSYCYNKGNLCGYDVGGILSEVYGSNLTANSTTTISYCYNAAKIEGINCAQIFCITDMSQTQYAYLSMTNCYADSSLSSLGLYWSSTHLTATGCSPYTTTNMQSVSDNTKPSNFENTWTTNEWYFKANQYPELLFKQTAPTARSATYNYDGSVQNFLMNDFNSNDMEITGVDKATDSGTYYVTIALKDTTLHKWANGSTTPVQLSWTINKTSLTKPTVTIPANLTFNDSVQYPTITGFDATTMEHQGTSQAINAGTYQFSILPKKNYQWSDGTTDALTFEWTIAKANIDASALPSQSGSLTYNGKARNVAWTSYDTTKLTVGGTTSAKNAGTYFATFTPTENYKFSDGAASKQVSWTISKKTLTNPSLNKTNNEFTFSGTTQDATSVLQNFDSTKMTMEGNTQALRAGTYIFMIYLKEAYKDNYVFANGRDFVTISWTILPFNIENGTVSVVGN